MRHIAKRFSPGFRRYFANTSWLLFGQISRSVIILFVGIYVARYLGPKSYGLLSYAVSFVALFLAIAYLGLGSIIVRELVEDEKKRDEILGTAFFLKATGSLLLLGIIGLIIKFAIKDSPAKPIIFVVALVTVPQSFGVIAFYFQSRVLSKYTVYCSIGSRVCSSVIVVLLIYFKAGVVHFAVVMLIESVISSLGLVVAYTKQGFSIFKWRIKLDLVRQLLRDSWPLILSGISVSIYMKIDQVMIKGMLDTEAVGNYAVSVRLSEAWYFVPRVFADSVFPAIVNARKMGEQLYHRRLEQLYALMTWSAIGIALPTTFLADRIVGLLFGAQYQHAAAVLKIYIWAGVFVFLGIAIGRYLVSENYTKINFLRAFIGMVVNIVLNIILIPRYGINGAAFATVVSYFMATFFVGFIPKTREQAVLMLKSANLLHVTRHKRKATPM